MGGVAGHLKHLYDDRGEEALERGYGIPFDTRGEAIRFSQWLSDYHKKRLR